MDSNVQMVLAICPYASIRAIERDLSITNSVPDTINRILDGVVENHCDVTVPSSPCGKDESHDLRKSTAVQNVDSSDEESLPSVSLDTKGKRKTFPDQAEARENKDTKDLISCDDNHDILEDSYISKPERSQDHPDRVDGRCEVTKLKTDVGEELEGSRDPHELETKLTSENDGLVNDVGMRLSASDHTETLDLTGSDSSEEEGRVDPPGIEISSSDECDSVEEDSVSNHGNSYSERLIASRKSQENKLSEQDQRSQKSTHLDDGKRSIMAGQHSKANMFEISSSDDSEDELPLWKRVQKKQHSTSNVDDFVNNTLLRKGKTKSIKSTDHLSNATRDASKSSSNDTLSAVSLPLATSESNHLQVPAVSKGEKRKIRSPEEIKLAKQQALERKADREKLKEEQNRKREEKKREKQREMDHRKALREAQKALRPEECMKNLTVFVDQSLLESCSGPPILQKLQDLDCKVSIIAQPIEGAITWSRNQMELNLGQDIQLDGLRKMTDETEALIVTRMDQFVHFLAATTQMRFGGCVDGVTLDEHSRSCIQALGGKSLTYIVSGVQEYFRNSKTRHQRNFRSAVLGEEADDGKTKRRKKACPDVNLPDVSRVQMEEALVDLQLQIGCNVRNCESPDTVSDFIAMFTKAIAEKPFKKQRDKATFSFHVNSEWAGGVKVAKNGAGLIKVWKQQLQQFRNVSPEMATAVVAQYSSPQLLLQGYKRCSSTKEAELLLQDILIRRGEGVLATSRRIGPELSKRIYKQMTAKDGNLLL